MRHLGGHPFFVTIAIFQTVFSYCSKTDSIFIEQPIGQQESSVPIPNTLKPSAPKTIIDSLWKIGEEFSNYYYYDGKKLSAQGIAIIGNNLYRFFERGICESFDITNLNEIQRISTFKLGSFSSSNHCNCAQIYITPHKDTLLYLAGMGGKCYVERINKSGSTLLQTITMPELALFDNAVHLNMICGDKGYLWFFGHSQSKGTLHFAKALRPNEKHREVEFSTNDVKEHWSEEGYEYNKSVWQGGKVYGDYLYFLFGTQSSHKHISIYNILTHEKENDINLDGLIKEEPEDCEIIENLILLAVNGGKGFYIIRLKEEYDQN